MTKRRAPEPVEYGTDNIFADLKFANPEEHLAKAKLASSFSTSVKCALVAGCLGTKSWQQSWSGTDKMSKVPIRRT